MFLGEYTHTLDVKGRLTVPARFRAELARGAVVTIGFDRCLAIYTLETFEKLAQRARSLSITDMESRALFRHMFSRAYEVTLDKSNRINIPVRLREYAGLDSEVVVVGTGDSAELWNPAGWQEQSVAMNDPEANAQRFAAINLALGS